MLSKHEEQIERREVQRGDATPTQQHHILLRLREHYQQFQKLHEHVQAALWPIGYARWHAEFLDEEKAANG
jgi:hypothetical protein